jgi:hypothetical protein
MTRQACAGCLVLILGTPLHGAPTNQPPHAPALKKQLSHAANFITYAPETMVLSESADSLLRTVLLTNAAGTRDVGMVYGPLPAAATARGMAARFLARMRERAAMMRVTHAWEQGARVVLDVQYVGAGGEPMACRCWTTCRAGNGVQAWIAAPTGEFAAARAELLTMLGNVHVTRDAFRVVRRTPPPPPLQSYALPDGSASLLVPVGWQVQPLGPCTFIARDPRAQTCFMVASVDVLSPALGVNVPGVPVADYLAPHRALAYLAGQQGIAQDMRFLEVTPCTDLTEQIGQVYTVGPVSVERFLYTCDAGQTKGYTFGISFGSRLNTGWKFWHMTASAPAASFDTVAVTFVKMFESYRINDRFAEQYIANGMARLRELQRQTSALVARNAAEIHAMMQAAFEERMRSWDYIDYQRSNYIRGEQDWVSSMEGGTLYHSDRWGTRNTATGDYYEGQPYNYFNYTGDNPKYNEHMTAIDSRALWERYVR